MLTALALVGCVPTPQPAPATCDAAAPSSTCDPIDVGWIESATFSQSQAIDGFDSTVYLMTDDAQLERLASILAEHGVTEDFTALGECDGGRTTDIVWTAEDGTSGLILTDNCAEHPIADQIDELVTEWRSMPDPTPAPLPTGP